MENWKDVKGYEKIYQVSDRGRVKALFDPERATHKDEHFLRLADHRGYKMVALCKNGVMKHYQVHRLVAEAFLEKPEGKDFVDHINTIKDDNRVENLCWCSEIENNNNPITKIHRSESKKGEKNPNYGKNLDHLIAYLADLNAKPVIQYDLSGAVIGKYKSVSEASKATNVFAGNISRVCQNRRATAGGFVWKYAS